MKINKMMVDFILETRGETYADLARRLGWDKAFLSRFLNHECKDRTIETILRFSRELGGVKNIHLLIKEN